jgi:L-aminopeptidase/D-esterase-like protein
MHRPGPRNAITDVPGLRVGHYTDAHTRSGTTVLLPDTAWDAGVDVRGGGPGVRETAALEPENSVGKAHALVFSGGSVFGLAAADGVAEALSPYGVGLRLHPNTPAVPIVPAAVLYDLHNGGDKQWGADPPYRDFGKKALAAASRSFTQGPVGAGTGARAGTGPGGVGSVSLELGDGLIVGALVVANPIGSALMPDGETYWSWALEIDGEFGGKVPRGAVDCRDPIPELSRLSERGRLVPGANTTLAAVAVNARLLPGERKRVAMMAHDGIARSVRPAHLPFDGDTVFVLANGERELPEGVDRNIALARIGSAAADCVARAIARGVHLARQGMTLS